MVGQRFFCHRPIDNFKVQFNILKKLGKSNLDDLNLNFSQFLASSNLYTYEFVSVRVIFKISVQCSG